MTNDNLFISPIIGEINKLEKVGFENSGNRRIEGGSRLQVWVRQVDWKKEKIQLHYPSQNPEWCEITFWMYLIIDNQQYYLTSEDVGQLIHSKRRYRFPSFLKEMRKNKIVATIAKDVVSSMSWFDDKNKQEVIRLINSDNENIAIKSTKPIYSKAMALLNKS